MYVWWYYHTLIWWYYHTLIWWYYHTLTKEHPRAKQLTRLPKWGFQALSHLLQKSGHVWYVDSNTRLSNQLTVSNWTNNMEQQTCLLSSAVLATCDSLNGTKLPVCMVHKQTQLHYLHEATFDKRRFLSHIIIVLYTVLLRMCYINLVTLAPGQK